MKIAILDDYQDCIRQLDCFSLLEGHQVKVFTNSARGLGQLSIRLATFDALILIGDHTPVSRQLINKLPNLKFLAYIGGSVPPIDTAAAAERGIVVKICDNDPVAAAELTWALILAAQRRIVDYAGHLRAGAWQTSSLNPERNTVGATLRGKTLGIWGYGRVGQLVAAYGRAFGMRVVVWGSAAGMASATRDGFANAASRSAFLKQADVVSLHLRLSETTRARITASDLATMKNTALLVNTSHAALIAPGALHAALAHGRPGAAALDVLDEAPLASDASLLSMENVLATPHIGFITKENHESNLHQAFQALVDFATWHASGRLPETPPG